MLFQIVVELDVVVSTIPRGAQARNDLLARRNRLLNIDIFLPERVNFILFQGAERGLGKGGRNTTLFQGSLDLKGNWRIGRSAASAPARAPIVEETGIVIRSIRE